MQKNCPAQPSLKVGLIIEELEVTNKAIQELQDLVDIVLTQKLVNVRHEMPCDPCNTAEPPISGSMVAKEIINQSRLIRNITSKLRTLCDEIQL